MTTKKPDKTSQCALLNEATERINKAQTDDHSAYLQNVCNDSRGKVQPREKCCSSHRLIREYKRSFTIPEIVNCTGSCPHGTRTRERYDVTQQFLCDKVAVEILNFSPLRNHSKGSVRVCKGQVHENILEHSFVGQNSRFLPKILLFAKNQARIFLKTRKFPAWNTTRLELTRSGLYELVEETRTQRTPWPVIQTS